MKKQIWTLVLAVMLGMSTPVWAALDFTGLGGGSFSASWSGSQVIADAPSSGIAYALTFNSAGYGQLTDITFTFTTAGGWNGDMYAYLSHGSGVAILLNKVGASAGGADGYGTSGFSTIKLGMGGVTDIHNVQNPTSGTTYAADGRLDYTSATRDHTLAVFNNANPNGSWTLFFGDVSSTFQSTLTSWSLDIAAVPEPVNLALGVFAGLGVMATLWPVRPWQRKTQTAAGAGNESQDHR